MRATTSGMPPMSRVPSGFLFSSVSLSPSFLPHRSERRGERVAGVDDFPLQGRVDGTDEQLQSRFVEVVGKVLLFRDQ